MKRANRVLSILLAVLMCFAQLPVLDVHAAVVAQPPPPGNTIVDDDHVTIQKYATLVEGTDERVYDITLKVTGKPHETQVQKPVDLVLVLDLSASMEDYVGTLQSAANTLITQFLAGNPATYDPTVSNRVSVVAYSTTAWLLSGGGSANGFTADKTFQLSGLSHVLYTNTEAALAMANSQLTGHARPASQAVRAVLFMTDGLPTTRDTNSPLTPAGDPYAGVKVSSSGHSHDWAGSWSDITWTAATPEIPNAYDSLRNVQGRRVSNGNWTEANLNWNNIWNNPTELAKYSEFRGQGRNYQACQTCERNFNAAHNAAQTLKPNADVVASVGLFTSSTPKELGFAQKLLTSFSKGTGHNYLITTDPAQLLPLFNQVVTDISVAGENASVLDKIPTDKFEIIAGGDNQPTLNANGEFTWTIGTIMGNATYTYSYRVKAKTDVFGEENTNISATLSYDFDGEEQDDLAFPVPRVSMPEPGLAIVKTITSGHTVAKLGDVIGYKVTVSNPGTLAVRGVTVTDKIEGVDATPRAIGAGPYNIAPGESVDITYTVEVTQAMLNAIAASGKLKNVATATAPGEANPGGPNYKSQGLVATDDEELPLQLRYAIEIVKSDKKSGAKLQGVQFKLYDSQKQLVSSTVYTTDANGVARIENLAPGTYYVKEVSPLPGYKANNDYHRAVVQVNQPNGKVVIEVKNEPIAYKIKVIKTDAISGKALKGVVFEIYKGDVLQETITTDNSGHALSSKTYYPGTYTVIEKSVPNGYVLDTTPREAIVTVNGGMVIVRVANQRTPYPIKVVKTDKVSGKPLQGAIFEIYNSEGALQETITTNVLGIALSANLYAPGTYTVIEKEAPAGYERDTTEYKAQVMIGGGKVIVRVKNERTPYPIQIVKTDSQTDEPLAGVKFKLYREVAGEKVPYSDTIYTTGSDGTVTTEALAPGTYFVKEEEGLAGYKTNGTYYEADIKVNQAGGIVVVEVENDPIPYKIKVIKADKVSGAWLKGATFEIYKGDVLQETVTTNKWGYAISANEYLPGTYTVVEKSAPDGYDLNSTPHTVNVTVGGGMVTVTVKNERTPYKIQVIKLDAVSKQPLAGVTFGIYKGSTLLESITTNGSGVALSTKEYAPGTYKVVEMSVPKGYELDQTPRTVEIKVGGGMVTITVKNARTPYPIKVIKTDEISGKPLKGATFGIYKGFMLQEKITTNAFGWAISSKLYAPGSYTVKELTAPNGYVLDQTLIPVEIEIGGGMAILRVKNARTPYPIKVIKTDEISGKPLKGATFGIYQDGELQESVTTNRWGWAISSKLYAPGTYTVKETQAPAGYELNETEYTAKVKLGGGMVIVTATNARTPYPIEIIKRDAVDERPLQGAKYGIYAYRETPGPIPQDQIMPMAAWMELLEEVETDEFGVALSQNNYAPGTYYVMELVAPDGYELNEQTFQVDVTIGGGKVTLDVYNERTPYPIEIIKLDAVDEKPLQGAKYGIYEYKASGNGGPIPMVTLPAPELVLLEEVETDEFGVALSQNNYAPGRYIVKELVAPNGYELNEEEFPVDVEIGGGKVTLYVYNERTPYPIEIQKIDATSGEPLEGVEFGIYDGEQLIETVVTDKDGKALSAELYLPGTYTVKEVAPPAGYLPNPNDYEVTVTINAQGGKVVIEVPNTRISYAIRIVKVDADDETLMLEGAVFSIMDSDKVELMKIVTDKFGGATTTLLMPGNYFIKEISAPEGYKLDDTLVPVEIKVGGGDVVLTLKNTEDDIDIPDEPPPEGPPETGEGIDWMMISLASTLLMASAALLLYNRRRNAANR